MIQTSYPLNCYCSQKSQGHFTTEHRQACPLYAGGSGVVGLFFYLLSFCSLALLVCSRAHWLCQSASKPTRRWGCWGERGNAGGELRHIRGRLEKGIRSLKWIWGKMRICWKPGRNMGKLTGKGGRKSCTHWSDNREMDLSFRAEERSSTASELQLR